MHGHEHVMEDQGATRTFTGNAMASRVLAHMLNSPDSLSDVTVRVGTKQFTCHRSVLAASSPVFRAMFQSDMKEPNTGVLDLPDDVPPSVFNALRDYLYGQPLKVAAQDALPLSAFVRRYEVASGDLEPFLDSLLASAITLHNVMHIRRHADSHDAHRLQRACNRFLTMRMQVLADTPAFLDAPVEDAEAALSAPAHVSRDLVSARCAQHVFAAAIAWLHRHEDARRRHVDRILGTVELENLSLPALVRASRQEIATDSPAFQTRLLRAFSVNAERYVTFGSIRAPFKEPLYPLDDQDAKDGETPPHRHINFLSGVPPSLSHVRRRAALGVPFVHSRFPSETAVPSPPSSSTDSQQTHTPVDIPR